MKILERKAEMWGQDIKSVTDATLEVSDHVRFMCNTCKTETIQALEAIHSIVRLDRYGRYDPNDIWQEDWDVSEEECQYRLFICQGCGTACLHEGIVSTNIKNQFGISEFHPERYIPNARTLNNDLIPKQYNSLPSKLSEAYREAIEAYNSNLWMACAVVLRALLEGICIEKGILDQGSTRGLESKLKMMVECKILSENIVDGLHMFKFMGDDAAHRLETPKEQELKEAIGIMEDLLNMLYEINYRLTAYSAKQVKAHPEKYARIKRQKDLNVKI